MRAIQREQSTRRVGKSLSNLAIFACLLAWAAFGAEPADPAPIDLRFGWQPGMRCTVTRTIHNIADPEKNPNVQSRTFVVSADPAGLRIGLADLKSPRQPIKDKTIKDRTIKQKKFDEIWAGLEQITLESEFTVSSDGKFIGIADAQQVQERMRALRSKAPDTWMFDALLKATSRNLEAGFRNDWLDIVGDWHNIRITPGTTSTVTLDTSLAPAVQSTRFDLPTRATLTGPRPCSNRPEASCVTLVLEQKPSDAEIADLVKAIQEADELKVQPYFRATGVEKQATLEFEPDTLTPHASVEEVRAVVINDQWKQYDRDETRRHVRTERKYSCINGNQKS